MAKEIYVGHISENASEEDVWKLFSVMGTVTSVHLIIDPDTGEFKRCGYVRMQSGVDLNEVVESLDGAYLIDREIVVSIARPQKPGLSKSGGNKQPWMKSGPKADAKAGSKPRKAAGAAPAAKAGHKPSSKPPPRNESAAGAGEKAARGARPATKPAAARPAARPSQGRGSRPESSTPRPRRSR